MRKGISLVALVVTIIVLIILTGAIVLTAFNNGILERSEEAVFKSDMQTFQEELTMYIMNQKAKFEYSEVNVIYNDNEDEHYNNMKVYLKSFSKKYASKVQIVKDKIEYIGSDQQEKQWVKSLGITVNSVEVVGDISDWELSNETNVVRIIGYKGSKTKDVEIPNVLEIDGEKKVVTYINLLSSTNKLSGSLTIPSNVTVGNMNAEIVESTNKLIIKDKVTIGMVSQLSCFEEIIIGNNCILKGGSTTEYTINSNITIGNNCTINDYAFSCANINGNVTIGSNANIGMVAFAQVNINGNVTIGDGSIINFEAFSPYGYDGYNGITGKVKIGNNVYIDDTAFMSNNNITSIELGENVVIGKQAFIDCINLEGTINIPASTSVYEQAFYGCSNADIVVLGTLVYEAEDAFEGCKSVTRK